MYVVVTMFVYLSVPDQVWLVAHQYDGTVSAQVDPQLSGEVRGHGEGASVHHGEHDQVGVDVVVVQLVGLDTGNSNLITPFWNNGTYQVVPY